MALAPSLLLATSLQLGSHLSFPSMAYPPAPDEAELVLLTASQIASRFSGKILRYRQGPQPAEGQGLFCPDGTYLREVHRLGLRFGDYTIADGVISIQLRSDVRHPILQLSISTGEMDRLFARWDSHGWAEIEFEDPVGQPCADAPRVGSGAS